MAERHGFATRGVLECFYGDLWSAEERASIIRILPEYGANLYVYGPAADPRTGAQWRDPYRDSAAAQQDALLEETRQAGVRAAWRVSPSAPVDRSMAMHLGDEEEQELLVRRCLEQLERGYELIVLAFDDIDTAIDPVTRSRFGNAAHPLAAAHADVANRVHRAVQEAGAQLVVCPTHYWGSTPSRYRTEFGRLVDDDLALWWTGPAVCADAITVEDVQRVAEQYRHPLWIWDNYPVNDWAASERRRWFARAASPGAKYTNDREPDQLLGAPLARRDARLPEVVDGYAGNAAAMPQLSRLIVRTVLDYARDPAAYDPDAALADALAREQVPGPAYRTVLRELGATPVSLTTGTLAAISARLVTCGPQEAELTTDEEERLDTLLEAVTTLRAVPQAAGIVRELGPWLDEIGWAVNAVRGAARVLRAWDERDQERLYAGAASLRDHPRADLPARPLVAGGAVDAVTSRVIAVFGPGAPDWPDEL